MAQEIIENERGGTLRQMFRVRGGGAAVLAQYQHEQFSNPLHDLANEDLLNERGIILDISTEDRKRLTEVLDHPDGGDALMDWIQQGGNY
jgi:hypothetical protein